MLQLVFATVAGAGALVALIVAYRRQKITEADSVHDRTRVFNERFTAIATHLGDARHAVRLAGVHAMAVDFRTAEFSGGTVEFQLAVFSSGAVGFEDAGFSGGTVSFSKAVFSGSTVDLRNARFDGGRVDFSDVRRWSPPPMFSWDGNPPAGVVPPVQPSEETRGQL